MENVNENGKNEDMGVVAIEKSAEPRAVEKQEQGEIVFDMPTSFIKVLKQFAKIKGENEPICFQFSPGKLHIKEINKANVSMLELEVVLAEVKRQLNVSFYPKDIIKLKFDKHSALTFIISENSIKIKQNDKQYEIKAFQGKSENRELNFTYNFEAVLNSDALRETLNWLKNFYYVKISLSPNKDSLVLHSTNGNFETEVKLPMLESSGVPFNPVMLSTEFLSDLVAFAEDKVSIYFKDEATPVGLEFYIGGFYLVGYLAPIIE